MNNNIAIAWLDGIRTNVKEAEPREALLKGIEAIEKLEQIQEIVKFSNANELGFEYVGEKITEVMEDA